MQKANKKEPKSEIWGRAQKQLSKNKEISDEVRKILYLEKTENKDKKRDKWLNEAKEHLKISEEFQLKATEEIKKSKELNEQDKKDESKLHAKKAKRYIIKAINNSKK